MGRWQCSGNRPTELHLIIPSYKMMGAFLDSMQTSFFVSDPSTPAWNAGLVFGVKVFRRGALVFRAHTQQIRDILSHGLRVSCCKDRSVPFCRCQQDVFKPD